MEWKKVKEEMSAGGEEGGKVELKQLHRDEVAGEVCAAFSYLFVYDLLFSFGCGFCLLGGFC